MNNSSAPKPFTPEEVLSEGGNGFWFGKHKFIHHSDLHHRDTAFFRINTAQLGYISCAVTVLGMGLYINWHLTLIIIVAMLTVLYFADLLFNLFLIIRSFQKSPEIHIADEDIVRNNTDWPTYSILCPLYRESHVLPQFVTAMSKMDYPKGKLEVLLLLEEDDKETIKVVNQIRLPDYFRTYIVPESQPKTKPKACNYGLTKAVGEYCVIYDAEDIPDPRQLKQAVVAFEKSSPDIICIQAKLNFYNPHQNVLTRIFTAEYSLWFDLVLTGLQSINAPIPLGGTSNHFRSRDLRKLKAWDPFNVTEDCDLGIRLIKHGYHTAIIDSVTLEEANSSSINWFRQRTRWIKGYMQTYLVHMRRPKEFFASREKTHIITFQLVVGGKILSMFINPFMWAVTISYFVLRARLGPLIESFYPMPVLYMGAFSLVFGNFLYLYYYMIGCAKRGQDDIIKYVLLVPFYWLAMSVAAWIASIQFLIKPHHWSKTIHGLHLTHIQGLSETKQRVGRELLDATIIDLPIVPLAFTIET